MRTLNGEMREGADAEAARGKCHPNGPWGPWYVSYAHGDASALYLGPEGAAMFVLRPPKSPFRSPPIDTTTLNQMAAHAARCVNAHDELIAALRLIAEWDHPSHPLFNPDSDDKPSVDRFAEIARAAIAKAEGA